MFFLCGHLIICVATVYRSINYPLAYVVAQAILVGKPVGRTILQNPFHPVHRAAIYNPDSCDCLHPEDRQGEVNVRIQNLWALFSLSQTPLKKIAHYNLLTSKKKKKKPFFFHLVEIYSK